MLVAVGSALLWAAVLLSGPSLAADCALVHSGRKGEGYLGRILGKDGEKYTREGRGEGYLGRKRRSILGKEGEKYTREGRGEINLGRKGEV
jgi:hypothetical protein